MIFQRKKNNVQIQSINFIRNCLHQEHNANFQIDEEADVYSTSKHLKGGKWEFEISFLR